MLVSDFSFDLPAELIAQHPPAQRGSSRMLVLNRATGALCDDLFANLPNLLQPGDLLILNDSRVLPARLFATRGGARTQHNSPQPSASSKSSSPNRLRTQHSPARTSGERWSGLRARFRSARR